MNTAINDTIIKTTTAFKILSDPTRFKILSLLSSEQEGLCVYELADAVGVSHSAASHQLTKLEARGIVDSFREGQQVCYKLQSNSFTESLVRVMEAFNH